MKPALITAGQITARLGIIAAGQIAAEHGMITAEQGVVAVWYLDGRNLRDGTSAVRVGPGFAGTGTSVGPEAGGPRQQAVERSEFRHDLRVHAVPERPVHVEEESLGGRGQDPEHRGMPV